MNRARVVAVIIGRAGSKGLPAKNSTPLPLCGLTPTELSIEHAVNARSVHRVLVSSDCPRMLGIAREAGVEAIERPASLASDIATVDSAVRHAIGAAGERSTARVVVMLYANVPIRPPNLIDESVQLLLQSQCDSVQSYCEVGKYHPYWMARIDTDGRVEAHIANNVYRRQDLPPLYVPDGGVIAVTCESLFTERPGEPHAFLGRDRRAIINPIGGVIDIDHAIDALVAGAMLSRENHAEVPVAAG